jgi:hypothetical protein
MKKFSKISKTTVNEKPKVENKITESDILKSEIMKLTDDLLRIQAYGPVDNHFLNGSVKIKGKEMLAEAILHLLENQGKKDKTKVLENLKSKIGDWETIDNSIEEINNETTSLNNKLKFNSILERYDDESLLVYMENINEKLSEESVSDYLQLVKNSKIKVEYKTKITKLLNNR